VNEDLSPLAERLGRHMAEQCADGLIGNFGQELLASFPDESVDTIAAALSELQSEGLVELSRLINLKLPRVRTTVALFVACAAGGSQPWRQCAEP